MKARSALWPRTATGTTWSPSASARLTADTMASASTSGVGLQNRRRTPQPTAGDTAGTADSVTAGAYGRRCGPPDSAIVGGTPVIGDVRLSRLRAVDPHRGDPHATPRHRTHRRSLLDRPDDVGQGRQPGLLRRAVRLDLRGCRRRVRPLRQLLPRRRPG